KTNAPRPFKTTNVDGYPKIAQTPPKIRILLCNLSEMLSNIVESYIVDIALVDKWLNE
ncbi:MAG: hypothetical protein EZS28_049563, partial [Streblomastix strix]